MMTTDTVSPTLPPRKRRFWLLLVPAAAVAVGIGLTQGKSSSAEAPAPSIAPAMTVATETVVARPVIQTLDVTGSVAAWDLLSVYPAANGLRIMQLYVEEGSRVSAGQLLAKLDDAALLAQYAQARARVATAEAALAKMRRPNRVQDLATFAAGLRQAEANVTSARDMHRRTQDLIGQGAVSPAEATARESALLAAQAAAEQARQRVLMAKEGSRAEDLRMAEAGLAAERANLQQVQVMLDQTRVTAPTAGLVISRSGHLGDVASPAQRLFQLVRDERYELQAQVPETALKGLQPGQRAVVTSDSDPELRVEGKLRLVSPSVDAASRLALVRIDLDRHPRLKAGMFVRGRLELGAVKGLAVPSGAVLIHNGTTRVFVLDGQVARSRAVTVGARTGDRVSVLSGLQAGDAVVVDGAGFLKDGDHVRVVQPLAAASDATAVAGH